MWSKNRKLVVGNWRREACVHLSPLNGTPPTHYYNTGQKTHSFTLVYSVNSVAVLCASIGSRPENVPPLLVGPWVSCFTSLSPNSFLHPWLFRGPELAR